MKAPALRLTVLMPVFNDWESARVVIRELDKVMADFDSDLCLMLVDDGSRTGPPEPMFESHLRAITRVESLRLRQNLGHQRAIAIGLSFLQQERECDAVVIMDADGEDKPEDVLRLVTRFRESGGKQAVFAARMRRSEGGIFQLCYHAYRGLHWLLTGIPVRMGNFSVLARDQVATLMVAADLWNHYAASVVKAKIPFETVPTARGRRVAGVSKLNFVALVIHGLSAISVFSEVVGVRLMLAISAAVLGSVALLVCVLVVPLSTDLAIPGWATFAAVLLLAIILQMLTVASALTLAVLFTRNNLSFLPIRDYRYFVAGTRAVYVRDP